MIVCGTPSKIYIKVVFFNQKKKEYFKIKALSESLLGFGHVAFDNWLKTQ